MGRGRRALRRLRTNRLLNDFFFFALFIDNTKSSLGFTKSLFAYLESSDSYFECFLKQLTYIPSEGLYKPNIDLIFPKTDLRLASLQIKAAMSEAKPPQISNKSLSRALSDPARPEGHRPNNPGFFLGIAGLV